MDALLTAIFTRYNAGAGAALRALTTGMYHAALAPESTVAPYITYTSVSSANADTMSSEHIEPLIQWSTWVQSTSPKLAWEINEELRVLYADVLLTVPGWSTIRAQVDDSGTYISQGTDEEDSQGVIMTIRYRIGR